uniref:Uncharacterized protein n=2 Tax=Amphora coffeiformis TaxID=265554 RepID=A0A7S3L2A2_9STRA|mmetsp:Transcript_9071/g.18232  ORF Transcript_9071/g.18232 Transcript_9071/m.18232 type:complete len:625 (+) Transcript_9071:118-1992(+)|eukprot:scaffold9766_cov268-Amphora_coffeaeformis.AAC.7
MNTNVLSEGDDESSHSNNDNENSYVYTTTTTPIEQQQQEEENLDELLLQCLATNSFITARDALELGAQSGTEALLAAACQGNVAFLDLLLDFCQPTTNQQQQQQQEHERYDNPHKRGVVDVNGVSPKTGLTALHHGVLFGHVPTVRLLLEKGHADPNVTTGAGGGQREGVRYSPLQCLVLATEPNLEMLQLLLDHGAKVQNNNNNNNHHIPLLHLAQHTEVVQKLLEAGGPTYAHVTTTPGGFTALHTAASDGNIAKMQLLLQVGGTRPDVVDSHGETALHWACAAGQVLAVRHLLLQLCRGRAVALLQQCNHQGQTPFMVACAKKQIAVAMFLWNDKRYRFRGCNDPWQRDTTLGYTALHWLCTKPTGDQEDNNDSNTNTIEGEIMLNQLARSFTTVPGLVTAKSDLSQYQALHLAAQWSATLCKCLIRQGRADVATQEPFYGRNAILQAARHGCLETLTCLLELEHRQTVRQATDMNGWNALHWAAWNHRPDMMRVFLQYHDAPSSAAVNIPNNCGRLPMYLLGALGSGIHTEDINDKCLDELIDDPYDLLDNDADDRRLEQCVSILVHAGANLRTVDSRGDLPFFVMAAMERVGGCFVALRAAAGQGLFDGNALQRSHLVP